MGGCSSKLGASAPSSASGGAAGSSSCAGQPGPMLLGAGTAASQKTLAYAKKEADTTTQRKEICDVGGFEQFLDKDAFMGLNAEVVPSADICAVKQYCAERGYGGFAVWSGNAYLRQESADACRLNLVDAPGVTFYINNNPPATQPREIKAVTYNLFWWNLYGVRGGADASASKLIAAADPDMMGCQECDDILRVLDEGGLRQSYAAISGPHGLAMAYKTEFWEPLGDGWEVVAEDQPGLFGSRAAQWMRLRRKSDGRAVFFMNHHGPLPVNTGGVSGGAATAENILRAIDVNSEPGDAIILLGDFNAQPGSETVLGLELAYPRVYTGESFGGVDHVFSPLAVVSSENLGAGGSDHDALAVTFVA